MADTAQASAPLEVRLEPGTEGVIRLVAVAPIQLDLSLSRWNVRREGRYYKLTLKGTQKNLPKDATCRVLVQAKSLGTVRDSELGSQPLKINGQDCTLELAIDVFGSGLFGKGAASLTVIPDFPFAAPCVVSSLLEFDNPLDVEGAIPGKVQLGKRLELKPVLGDVFKESTLRLSVLLGGALKAKKANAPAWSVFEWGKKDLAMKEWRVGCALSDGEELLTYLGTKLDEYVFDLRLEVRQETEGEKVDYLVWERLEAVSFRRPKLTGFSLGLTGALATVDHVDPDFSLPLELSLWQYGLQEIDSIVEVLLMDPITRPAIGKASSAELFRKRITAQGEERTRQFALLRIPKTLSGTQDYVPISAVMDYDESRFRAFDDDSLWLEPPRQKKGVKASKQQQTIKDLVTAIASEELTVTPTRAPRFGTISTGVQENNLLVSIKLVGADGYWAAVAPFFSLCGEDGQTELIRLKTRPSETNPKLHQALVPLDDPKLLGKKVRLRGQVAHPGASLWDELVAAPPTFSIAYEGVPRLSDLAVHTVELTDATSYLQVCCQTHHIPNGKKGSVLGFRLSEHFVGVSEPVLLPLMPFQYDLSQGAGGQCDSHGQLVARIKDAAMVKKLKEGMYTLEAWVLDKESKVLSSEVGPVSMTVGRSPRMLSGTMVWGMKVPDAFYKKVLAICDHLKIKPDYLMACMEFETGGTFSAKKKNNAGHEAYGLIQFTQAGTDGLGKTLNELKAMTELEQLDYVHKFMDLRLKGRGASMTLSDIYMAILCPEAIGEPDTYVCYSTSRSPKAYEANKGLDRNKKGSITKADATVPVELSLKAGETYRQ